MKKSLRTGLLCLSIIFPLAMAQTPKDKSHKNVIYKYKKYESFDLGSLEIKGNIIAPGDLSVRERSRRTFTRELYERLEFDGQIRRDIRSLR